MLNVVFIIHVYIDRLEIDLLHTMILRILNIDNNVDDNIDRLNASYKIEF